MTYVSTADAKIVKKITEIPIDITEKIDWEIALIEEIPPIYVNQTLKGIISDVELVES